MENQSPTTEKIYTTEDFYPLPTPNTTPVSPVPISTVVPVPRMNYDVPYSPTYPTAAYSTPQPNYNTPPNYPEIYNAPSHNMVLMNGTQQFGQQSDFTTGAVAINNQVETAKRLNWETVVTKSPQNPKSRSSTKTLAELHQRKQEVLSQLEKVVGKNAATAISNSATNLARQESHHDMDSPTSPYYWPSHISTGGPTFVRSDSILADDDYVPYEAPCVSKYGPISRMHKENVGMGPMHASAQFRDGNLSTANLVSRK